MVNPEAGLNAKKEMIPCTNARQEGANPFNWLLNYSPAHPRLGSVNHSHPECLPSTENSGFNEQPFCLEALSGIVSNRTGMKGWEATTDHSCSNSCLLPHGFAGGCLKLLGWSDGWYQGLRSPPWASRPALLVVLEAAAGTLGITHYWQGADQQAGLAIRCKKLCMPWILEPTSRLAVPNVLPWTKKNQHTKLHIA